MKLSKSGTQVLAFAGVVLAAGALLMVHSPFHSARRLASIEADRPVHEFDPVLVERIVRPNRSKGEKLLQNAVVPSADILKVYQRLDQSKDLAWQMEMTYGLHEYTTSYYNDVPSTFTQFKGQTMGVSPNCFVCHSSRVEGKIYFGLGSSRVDLRSFFGALVRPKFSLAGKVIPNLIHNVKPVFSSLDELPDSDDPSPNSAGKSSLFKKLFKFGNRSLMMLDMFNFVLDPDLQSISAGHSNPWSFAVQLFKWRDREMNYLDTSPIGRGYEKADVVLDPMPWWLLKYKNYINWDSIIRKSHRGVVQAVLSPGKSGAEIRAMDPEFKEIFDEMHRLDPPVFPKLKELDPSRVAQGEKIFNTSCAECHGIHSENGVYRRDPELFKKDYPERIFTPEKIGTDPHRAQTINLEYLRELEQSWMAFYGDPKYAFRMSTLGYVAPPLWGLWASAPYFHNGSVPTLSAVLFPETRPVRWKLVQPSTRSTPFDYEKVGLKVIENPEENYEDPKIYDTTYNDGRSKDGHEWIFKPLGVDEKKALLDYLKTL